MSASPSFIKQPFAYSEDKHFAPRQAAARGDIAKIKALLKAKEILDINSPA